MRSCGLTSTHEFLGDFIVYRNLVPYDERLPRLERICVEADVPVGAIPRKHEPAYARIIVRILQQARALTVAGSRVERLLYVGDTRMLDGGAFTNMCMAGGLPGLAFIGADRAAPVQVEIVPQEAGTLYLANRWSAIVDFDAYCAEHKFPIDEGAAVVIDLDKTAVGARGRNDHAIDEARVAAVRRTVGELLGDTFDNQRFQVAYDLLNQPMYHQFTADNQDYLAYICLILGSGLFDLECLAEDIQSGRLNSFEQFLAQVEVRALDLSRELQPIHHQIYALVQRGDPTPFKAFRYNEYQTTIAKFGALDDTAPVEELLKREIVITQEVREMALRWREQGALLFGLSDKPDEASMPSAELAAQGYQPIHRALTHAVGA